MSQNAREPIICRDYEDVLKIVNSRQSKGHLALSSGKKRLSILLVGMFIISSLGTALLIGEAPTSNGRISYVAHAPINISGDADMAATAATEHWGGSGTALDPYLINGTAGSGYEIDATGFFDGIIIENTRAHFRIPGALIYSGTNSGIHLSNAMNGSINGSSVSSNRDGIWVENGSSNISMTDVDCSTNLRDGIYIELSNNVTIAVSICDNNDWSGIFASQIRDINVGNTSCQNNDNDGITMQYGGRVLLDNNTCSSEGNNGISIYDSFGFIIRSNTCSLSVAAAPGGNGIYADWTYYSTIVNNTCENNGIGIQFQNSEGISFLNDTCRFSSYDGMHLDSCTGITVAHCLSSDNFAGDGILCTSPTDALIENNTCDRNYYGINLGGSSGSLMIMNNSCSNNTVATDSAGIRLLNNNPLTVQNNLCNDNANVGILLWGCTSPQLVGNIANHNNWGIYLDTSLTCTLTGNTMIGDGIFLSGSNPTYWDTHVIDTSNLVNGKPVYYMNAPTYFGVPVPAGAGQVLVASSSNLVILGQNLSGASVGIEVGFSNGIVIIGNSIWYGIEGIYCYQSSFLISLNTVAINSDNGIYVLACSSSTIANNNAISNELGIATDSGAANTVDSNTCSGNSVGIYIHAEWGDEVKNNGCTANVDAGIRVRASDNCTVHNNTCVGSTSSGWGYGLFSEFSYDVQYYGNNVSSNRVGIMVSDSHRNHYQYNLIANNTEYGVRIDAGVAFYSHRNTIYNNTFLYNNGATDTYSASHVQAWDDGINTSWNTSGTPHGFGNYWSDWTTPDVNGNGIVDVNYTIDGGASAISYWPLTQKHWVPIPEGDLFVLVALMGAVFLVAARRNQRKDL
jgi:parallel beta-helix repeat protein